MPHPQRIDSLFWANRAHLLAHVDRILGPIRSRRFQRRQQETAGLDSRFVYLLSQAVPLLLVRQKALASAGQAETHEWMLHMRMGSCAGVSFFPHVSFPCNFPGGHFWAFLSWLPYLFPLHAAVAPPMLSFHPLVLRTRWGTGTRG